jgi:Xaa-Pro dipeptidase
MSQLPAAESIRRIEALQALLAGARPPIDAAVLVQNVDVYYFSGTFQSCHLIVPARGAPRLLVRKVLERAREDSPLDDVRPMTSLRDLPAHLAEVCGGPPRRVAFETDVVPAKTLDAYRSVLGPGVEVAAASDHVLEARSVKSEWEIERIREASRTIARVFLDLPSFLAEDISTFELQSIIECRARTLGHPGIIRMRGLNVECSMAMVVSGPEGAAPSHSFFPIGGRGPDPAWPAGGDFVRIRPDTPVIVDCLGCSAGYYADQTRMAVKGRFPAEAGRIYAAMVDLLRHCEKALRAGAVPSRVFEEVLGIAESKGLAKGFLGPPGHAVGFIGHGIGLEVNEGPVVAPKFDRPLAAGTVLAIEPKFTHPEFGVIGIESTYVVREGGLECLTPLPETVVLA